MSTFTNSTTPVNTAASQFYLWSHPISNFMGAAGANWVQQNDTGQIAWPVSVFNITDALENGGNTAATFTGTIPAGASPLVLNQSVLVSGTTNFGTVAAPKRWVVTGGNLTTTFTANGTAVGGAASHDTPVANTGWGMVEQSMTVSSITVAGGVITVTCAIVSGTLRIGQSVVVAGTTAGTYDGTYVITGGNLTTTFTAATGVGESGAKIGRAHG